MKKHLPILSLLLIANLSFGQSENDTKDFIIEKYSENSLDAYSPSYIFFSNNILKTDADAFANRLLTEDEFSHFFSCVSDIEVGVTESEILSLVETIDIRDISKVSTTKQDDNNYLISIYLNGNFPSIRYVLNNRTNKKKTKLYLPKMKIQIGNNKEVAIQIKKAIIHLGKLRNINIKDGDLF